MTPQKGQGAALVVAVMAVVVAWLTMLGYPRLAWAHGEAEIKVLSGPIVFGGPIIIEGQKFEEGDEVTLSLEGLTGEFRLGTVTADDQGRFRFEGTLPLAAHPGRYLVRARGKDATAFVSVRILASPEATLGPEHEAGLGFHRSTTAGTTVALAVAIALVAAGGVALAFFPTGRQYPSKRR